MEIIEGTLLTDTLAERERKINRKSTPAPWMSTSEVAHGSASVYQPQPRFRFRFRAAVAAHESEKAGAATQVPDECKSEKKDVVELKSDREENETQKSKNGQNVS